MLSASAGVLSETPLLQVRLNGFPFAPVPGVEDLFYWSLEKMGPRQVFSVTHMTLLGNGPKLFIVGMQIYGNHYLDGMVSVTRLESDPTQSARAWLEVHQPFPSRSARRSRRGHAPNAARRSPAPNNATLPARLSPTRSPTEPSPNSDNRV